MTDAAAGDDCAATEIAAGGRVTPITAERGERVTPITAAGFGKVVGMKDAPGSGVSAVNGSTNGLNVTRGLAPTCPCAALSGDSRA